MGMNTHEIVSNKTSTLLEATGTGAGTITPQQPAKAMKFSGEATASHTGTTTVDIQTKNGSLWETIGTLSIVGNSGTDSFVVDAVIGTHRANCTAHGDSSTVVTVREEW